MRLGINIDHVATLRNARGGLFPDPVRAALIAQSAGVDNITVHLREDQRHICTQDVINLVEQITIPINLEMAATNEMQEIASRVVPYSVCLVPERRQELTTEGGLDVKSQADYLKDYIKPLIEIGIKVACFIEPNIAQVDSAAYAGFHTVEIHTGHLSELWHQYKKEKTSHVYSQYHKTIEKLRKVAQHAASHGLIIHAGHGLNYDTAADVAMIKEIDTLNIGHFIIGDAIFTGLANVIYIMQNSIYNSRRHIQLQEQR